MNTDVQSKPQYDVILVSGEYAVDHPLSPIGVIRKVLQHAGFSVAVIEKPNWAKNDDFLQFGRPKLFFGVSAGTIDSMLCNYTPLKKKRAEDENEPYDSGMPDRAIIVYCNKLRECFKDCPIVIGGVEASMRRFAHYDYWINDLRKSILVDSRADILVYGNGEWQVVEIAKRLSSSLSALPSSSSTIDSSDTSSASFSHSESHPPSDSVPPISSLKPRNKNTNEPSPLSLALIGIDGTCVIAKEIPADRKFIELPAFDVVKTDKKEFCKMQMAFSNEKNLAQKQDTRFLLQFKMHPYTVEELDAVFELPYSRNIPDHYPEFKFLQFSVVTHRGCIGNCNFCSIALHQGHKILSRSEESILREITSLTKHKDFRGIIEDLGGPSANMYGMDCRKCRLSNCMSCKYGDYSHKRIIDLMRRARAIPGVKKIYVHSGVRYDLAVKSEEYIKELSDHHISGSLKIAPEHFSGNVLKLMNKYTENASFHKFKQIFEKYNEKSGRRQSLKYYFMTAHPGSSMKEAQELADAMRDLSNTESVQIFTPTPMSISTCMYYTGMDPTTMEPIYVPYTYNEKKEQKRILYRRDARNVDENDRKVADRYHHDPHSH